jgi:hypothetical protein
MTADEAKALWPHVLAELDGAWGDVLALVQDPPVDLVQMVKARYEAGCEEFKGDWTTREEPWFTDNAKEELADLVTYLAFRRVRAQAGSVASSSSSSSGGQLPT